MYIRAEGVGRALFGKIGVLPSPFYPLVPAGCGKSVGTPIGFQIVKAVVFSVLCLLFDQCTMFLITLSLRSVNFSGFDPGILLAALVCVADGQSAS